MDAGLSLAQFRILELVSRGTERSTHIASRLATSKPAVTVVVDGLVGAGLLTRSSLPGDRRVIRLALTPDGRKALAGAEHAYRERLAPVFGEVSDPDALLVLLAEVDDVLDARWAARADRSGAARSGAARSGAARSGAARSGAARSGAARSGSGRSRRDGTTTSPTHPGGG